MDDLRLVRTEDRLREVAKQVRFEHKSDRERKEIVNIFERHNVVLYPSGGRLFSAHSAVLSTPRPGMDRYRRTANRNWSAGRSDGQG
jgi:hypothetical protein